MNEMKSKYPNLSEISLFDNMMVKILDRINVDYVKFHSGMDLIPKFGINEIRDAKNLPNEIKSKKKNLKDPINEKFLDEDLFY